MKCPHCNKLINEADDKVDIAFMNCENYGSDQYTLKHSKCGKKYILFLTRTVKNQGIMTANDDKDLSFG
jgi:hypothetical protein